MAIVTRWVYADDGQCLATGDVVRVRSGGPGMTIRTVRDDGDLVCVWFGDGGKLRNGEFPRSILDVRNGLVR